jgi:hypothetical protein
MNDQWTANGNNQASQELKEMILAGTIDLRQVITLKKTDVVALLQKKYEHLDGQLIGASDAAVKYKMRRPTFTDLMRSGDLVAMGRQPGRYGQILFNERDIAVLSELREFREGSRGPLLPKKKAS